MSKFEDHLWTELMREHGDSLAQASRPTAKHSARATRLVAGTGLGLAGAGAAVALVLGTASTVPAFAVTRNHDGTVSISIRGASGIAGVNARLRQLGIRATVTRQDPAGCTPQPSIPMAGKGRARAQSSAHWTIDPRKIRAGHQLVLTPPPAPPNANSGYSGSSGSGGPGGQYWSCGSEGGSGSPPSAPPGGNGGNSGISTTS